MAVRGADGITWHGFLQKVFNSGGRRSCLRPQLRRQLIGSDKTGSLRSEVFIHMPNTPKRLKNQGSVLTWVRKGRSNFL